MLVVKDAMVLIHLSKLSLLETACDLLRNVIIPKKVYRETVRVGKKKDYPNAVLIEEIINKGKIKVKQVKKNGLIKRARSFNIQNGEAEALALYWEEDADSLATDDDNVRKKKNLLDLDLIGTPVIILKLYKHSMIKKKKFKSSLDKLRKIGWFSNAVIDKIRLEGEKNG